jgi:TolA-binding protein
MIMESTDRGFMKYLPLVGAAIVLLVGITQLRRRRKLRSFRDDPIGALKDRSEIFVDRAQEATEEALGRLQESLDELRGRLPELNRKRMQKRRKELNKRLATLNEQAQALLKDMRSTSLFSR